MKNNRLFRCALSLSMFLAMPSAKPSAQEGIGNISDFMIMDVCVAKDGRVLPSLRPGDPGCVSHRDIKPGEIPPYDLSNFSSPGSGCAAGPVLKDNTPVLRNGLTRVVSSTIRSVATPCRKAKVNQTDGASIQWHDDAYGFIMGSYSPVALSLFDTPNCRNRKNWSDRFSRGWVIAPAKVPPTGSSGIGVFESNLTKGKASELPDQCPTSFRRALTSWFVTPFKYKSGREFLSIVSSHYAQVSPDGLSPGNTLQMEQTYWTRELGLSRWEKWAREDWINPRTQLSAHDAAETIAKRGRCSEPVSAPVEYSSEMEVTASTSGDGLAIKTIRNQVSGEQHLWYLTLCEDYTNLQTNNRGLDNLYDQGVADQSFWR